MQDYTCSPLPHKTTCKAKRVCMGLRRVRYGAPTDPFANLANMKCTHPLFTSFRMMQDYTCSHLPHKTTCKAKRVCMGLRRVRYGAPRPVRRPRKHDVHASAFHVISYDARLHLFTTATQNDTQSQARLHGFAACAIRGPDRPVRQPRKHEVHASAFHIVSYDARLHCSLLPYKTTCKAKRVCMGLRRVRYGAPTARSPTPQTMTCTHPLVTSFRMMQDYTCSLLPYKTTCKAKRVCMRLRRVRCGAPTDPFADPSQR